MRTLGTDASRTTFTPLQQPTSSILDLFSPHKAPRYLIVTTVL